MRITDAASKIQYGRSRPADAAEHEILIDVR
jgi:hypothetical protein